MVLASVILVGGCAVIHPTDPYYQFDPPKGIERLVSTTAVETVRPQDSLSLSRAIEIALANNPGIIAVAWEAERAAAQQNMAVGELLPRLYGTGGYTHNLDPQRLVAARNSLDPAVFSRDIASADVVLQVPLFSGGRLVNHVRAASLLEQAAKHRFARGREELIYNVTSVFYFILAQRRVVESVEFSRQTLLEHLKRVETLVESQKAALVDRLRTEVRLADVIQRLVRETNTLDIQHRLLANLLGLDSDAASLAIQGELTTHVRAHELDTDSIFMAAQLDRSDYLAAKAGLEAQARMVDAARGAHSPTLSLQGSYGYRWAVDDEVRVSGSSASEDIGRIGIVFDLPFFEGGRIRARVRAERARMAEQQARLRQLESQMQLELETALLNRQAASNRLEATGKAVDQATESLRIEREKYELGRGAIVDVLDAQAALLDAQTNHYRALADLNIAQAQLRLAAGSNR
jgi:outer membrane protein TolC